MNKSLHFGLTILMVISLLFSNVLYGQTTVGLGEIAFTGYQSDGEDKISFILLKPIEAGTSISFTDNGWTAGGGFQTFGPANLIQELVMTWTADVAYPCGAQILLMPNSSGSFNEDGTVAGSLVNPDLTVIANAPPFPNAPFAVNLAPTGDQIFAFQGDYPTGADMSGFIAAMQMNGMWQTATSTTGTSTLPSVFTNGVNALFVDPQIGNASYACGPPQLIQAGSSAQEEAININTVANWSVSSNADLDIPPLCEFFICCTELENIITDSPTCPTDTDGTVIIEASFCSLTGNYSISGPINASNTTGVFTGLPQGNYTAIVEDAALPEGTCADTMEFEVLIGTDFEAPMVLADLPPVTGLVCGDLFPLAPANASEFIAMGGALSDNCSAPEDLLVYTQVSTAGDFCSNGDPYVVTRTFYIIDESGNSTTAQQTLSYTETAVAPVIVSVAPTCYKYCASLANPAADDVTYTTSCNGNASVNITGPEVIGQENCPGTILRYSYTVTDDCQSISAPVTRDFIIGNDGPTISVPPFNLILECGNPNNQEYIDTHIGITSANTACGLGVTISYTPQNFNLTTCGSATVVTFVATDACGRQTTGTTSIAIQDETAPEFTSVPPSTCDVIECGADANYWFDHWIDYMIDGLEATDDCDNSVSITAMNPQLNTSCDATGKALSVVTFAAVDNCGNVATMDGTFTIQNTSPALISNVPANVSITCANPITFGDPTISGGCNATLNVTDTSDDTAPCAVQYTRTWTVTESCGTLSSSASQTITVMDENGPTISGGANLTIECGSDVATATQAWLATNGGATAVDDCTTVTWSNDLATAPTVIVPDCESGVLSYTDITFTAADDCGNANTVVLRVNIVDATAPVFTFVPPSYEGPCVDENGTVTVYAQVCSSSDDAEEDKADGNEGDMNLTSSDLELVLDDSQSKNVEVGIRFKELNIPAGATITSAYIQFYADATIDVDPSALTIHGEDSDNALTFTTEDFNISDRPKTISVVDWQVGDWQVIGDNHEEERTPDLTDIVQEIVDKPGYSAESALAFFINGTGKRTAIAYDLNPDQAPELFVTYNVGTDVFGTPTASDDCGAVSLTFEDEETADCVDRIRTWTATDDCGNTATIAQALNFTEDNIPPVFTFIPDHVNGDCDTITFPPTFGTPVVEDNCGGTLSLTSEDFFYEGDTDSCADEVDYDYRRLWTATDACGNSTTAVQRFNINGTDYSSLTGFIFTEEEVPVEEVAVNLAGFNGFNSMSMSQGNGTYGYNSLDVGANYSLTPKSNVNPLNGVSTYDIVLIAKHILQLELLDSPYKIIAADVNKSGAVTTMDMVELRKMILLINDEFPNNTSWRFVDANFMFPDPSNPLSVTFPEEAYINGLVEGEEHNYVGVKVGDVNGSVIPNSFMPLETRTEKGRVSFVVKENALVEGEEQEVLVRAEGFDAITGFQFALDFDATALDLIDVSPMLLPNLTESNFGLTKMNEGKIVMSWNNTEALNFSADAPLFKLTFKAKSAVKLSDVIALAENSISAEAYDEQLDFLAVDLRFENDVTVATNSNGYTLYQNQPNPFKRNTVIGFDLPVETSAMISIYDMSGRIVKEMTADFAKGYNEVSIDKSDLNGNGLLYYRLLTSDFEATKKMMLIE